MRGEWKVDDLRAALQAWSPPPATRHWGAREVITYALGVGAGYPDDLPLIYEAHGPRVLTGFAARLAAPSLSAVHAVIAEFEPRTVGQSLRVRSLRPLPAESASCVCQASAAVVLHTDDHLLVELEVRASDATGPLAEVTHTVRVPAPAPGPDPRPPRPDPSGHTPTGDPVTRTVVVAPHLMPLYRLLGDVRAGAVPDDIIHIDPERARGLGLDRPILLGEQTLGILGRVATALLCPDRPERLVELAGRYSGMAYPGDELLVTVTPLGANRHALQAANAAGRPVIRDGLAVLTGDSA